MSDIDERRVDDFSAKFFRTLRKKGAMSQIKKLVENNSISLTAENSDELKGRFIENIHSLQKKQSTLFVASGVGTLVVVILLFCFLGLPLLINRSGLVAPTSSPTITASPANTLEPTPTPTLEPTPTTLPDSKFLIRNNSDLPIIPLLNGTTYYYPEVMFVQPQLPEIGIIGKTTGLIRTRIKPVVSDETLSGLDGIPSGIDLPLVGKNLTGDWVLIIYQDNYYWVSASLLEISGDIALLPTIENDMDFAYTWNLEDPDAKTLDSGYYGIYLYDENMAKPVTGTINVSVLADDKSTISNVDIHHSDSILFGEVDKDKPEWKLIGFVELDAAQKYGIGISMPVAGENPSIKILLVGVPLTNTAVKELLDLRSIDQLLDENEILDQNPTEAAKFSVLEDSDSWNQDVALISSDDSNTTSTVTIKLEKSINDRKILVHQSSLEKNSILATYALIDQNKIATPLTIIDVQGSWKEISESIPANSQYELQITYQVNVGQSGYLDAIALITLLQ